MDVAVKQKILLISSWAAGDVSKRREQYMKESPYLKDYEIFHVYAVSRPFQKIDEDSFFASLKKCIDNNQPDLLLVHTGVSFDRYRIKYISVLYKIKNLFPDLKMGVERGKIEDELLNNLELFESSNEVKHLENLFFNVVFYGLTK